MEAHITAVAAADGPLPAALDIFLPAAQAHAQPDSAERLVDTEARDERGREDTGSDSDGASGRTCVQKITDTRSKASRGVPDVNAVLQPTLLSHSVTDLAKRCTVFAYESERLDA